MKKIYETPSVEKIAFCYRDQVVVASGNFGTLVCTTTTKHYYEGNAVGAEACHISEKCTQTVDPSDHY